jgi:hypothetical protein
VMFSVLAAHCTSGGPQSAGQPGGSLYHTVSNLLLCICVIVDKPVDKPVQMDTVSPLLLSAMSASHDCSTLQHACSVACRGIWQVGFGMS